MNIVNRRRYVATELPGEYKKLEYIENMSNAYINTGIPIRNGYVWYMRMQSSLDASYKTSLLHGVICNGPKRFMMGFNGNPLRFTISYNSLNSLAAVNDKAVHDYVLDSANMAWSISGVGSGNLSGTTTFPSDVPIYIFARNNRYDTFKADFPFIGKVYSCTIKKEGALVLDLIPAKRKSDGKIGMYDTVSKRFLTSPNGANFIGA